MGAEGAGKQNEEYFRTRLSVLIESICYHNFEEPVLIGCEAGTRY